MYRFKIEREEDLGCGLIKIVKETYLLPYKIPCPEHGTLMYWNMGRQAYLCDAKGCKGMTGKEYVEAKLQEIKENSKNEIITL